MQKVEKSSELSFPENTPEESLDLSGVSAESVKVDVRGVARRRKDHNEAMTPLRPSQRGDDTSRRTDVTF